MGQDVEYCNDNGTKAHENTNHVHYETCGQKQKYTKSDHCKQTEEKHRTKYVAGGGARQALRSGSSSRLEPHRSSSKACGSTQLKRHLSASRACGSMHKSSKAASSHCSKRSDKQCSPKKSELSLAQRMSHCYEIKRVGRRDECNRKPCWQHGKYVRDECGSGIVPKRFLLGLNRKLWCKTPLSMYQATIGELARKLLCQEISVPRDVRGEPPSNIAEYIMPLCRGYYRKYDCLRPCEEEYAIVKAGKKIYRDRVKRHWEPCLSKEEKHKLDINDYAPHNAYLALKLRRRNITDDELCW